jgi:hypothetical protein
VFGADDPYGDQGITRSGDPARVLCHECDRQLGRLADDSLCGIAMTRITMFVGSGALSLSPRGVVAERLGGYLLCEQGGRRWCGR